MSKPEMYISIDIETDGPCPGLNSMLSLGAVAYYDSVEVSSFEANLFPLDDGIQNVDTMKWWETQPEAWEYVNGGQSDPMVVIPEFASWLGIIDNSVNCDLVAVGWPAAFDFAFVNWYMHQYYGANPLGYDCLDIRSYANGLFGVSGYRDTRASVEEGDLYKFFGIDTTYYKAHIAIEDARKQGDLLMGLLAYAKRGKRENG